MKKIIVLTIALLAISTTYSVSQDLPLKKILKKHYKVMNFEKLSSVNTLTFEGNVSTQGMDLPFSQKIKRPGKVRMDIEVQGSNMIQAYNGEVGWMLAPFMGSDEPQDMGPDETKGMKEQADFEGLLWNWKDKVDKLEVEGKETIDGVETYKLKVTEKAVEDEETGELEDPNIRYIFIDAKEFTIVMTRTNQVMRGAEVEVERYESDFKEVDGFLMSHKMEVKIDGASMTEITIEKIEINKEIEDSIFDKPADE